MLHIPEDKLPQEFKDESRLDSLYSPFRSRSVNPRDWDTKISSWKHLISLYCLNNEIYSFNFFQLNNAFIRHGRPPSCLGTVLTELVKSGDLQYLDDYIRDSPKGWAEWAANILVVKPVQWSFNIVKRTLFTSKIDQDRTFVHVGVIRGEAQDLLDRIPLKYRNKVITFTEFLNAIRRDLNQSEQVKLILHHLVQEKKVDMRILEDSVDQNSVLIKVGLNDKVPEISEIDVSVYVLEKNEKIFTKHVEDLEDQITACTKEIKGHLLKGHRQLAKTCLKKKHEIEKRLGHKTNALHNVQVLLERVRDIHGDAEVWKSYKEAIAAFNSTVQETGITEDSVEDTMIKLGEMLDMHDDIQSAISKSLLVDDADLEEELAELMKTEEKSDSGLDTDDIDEQLSNLNLDDLPAVPSSNVSLPEAS